MWVKLDDQFPDHIKLARLGRYTPLCGWLYVCGLAFCNRQLTDGRIPKLKIHTLTSFVGLAIETGRVGTGKDHIVTFGEDVTVETVAMMLVHSGLWEEDEEDYLVHDYLEYQPSRASVIKDRNDALERKRQREHNSSPKVRATFARTDGDRSPAPDPDPDPKDQDQEQPARAGRVPSKEKRKYEPKTKGAWSCSHIPPHSNYDACIAQNLTDAKKAPS